MTAGSPKARSGPTTGPTTGPKTGQTAGQTPAGTRWTDYFAHHDTRAPRPFALAGFDLAEQSRGPGRAIDLGCGQGTETAELLHRGWSVLAVDADPEAIARVESLRTLLGSDASTDRLTTRLASFTDLDALPVAGLVHAGFSLPFCPAEHFPTLWSAVEAAVDDGGFFVGQLFGDRDSWATTAGGSMTFHSRTAVDRRFGGWDVLRVDEQDEDGNSLAGPKHWHIFHVIARRR